MAIIAAIIVLGFIFGPFIIAPFAWFYFRINPKAAPRGNRGYRSRHNYY